MLVYTANSKVKEKLLNNEAVLITERKVNDKLYSFFRINNPSIMNIFSYEENKEIIVCDNKLFL